ncbi:hypothetical protein CkaCkLH20_03118 [Colletotrichum karsti]|uniref:Clr5 domain-containing protein n=1 Tax=Colletotrichum karsti TaxID=1095194 RepID=A0A9P6IBI4_9PEZI|nr:uncharacterized protein CkaCkLH20_03118 [Colletotrichum karsti]KAF9879575.1 hypothetical protein CkaCkLH20_03118 [Colletotrichum karsti]
MDLPQEQDVPAEPAPRLAKGKLYATENHWTIHREIITRLYRDENKSLKEVKKIMEGEYFFYATDRMYKTRIKRWGLDKKFKEAEVLAILQLKRERDRLGKKSRFAIRDQDVAWDRVLYYIKRRPDLQRHLGFAAHERDVVDWDRVAAYLARRPELRGDLAAADAEITTRTPPPSPPPPPPRLFQPATGLRFADEIVRMLRDFLHGVFEARHWTVVDDGGALLCSRGKVACRGELAAWCGIMGGVYDLFRGGRVGAAVGVLHGRFDELAWIIRDLDPELSFFHCYIVLGQPAPISDLLLRYVCRMYAAVLGARHPLTLIWKRVWGVGAEDRVHILSAVVGYSARFLEERVGLLNVTLNWIHGLQGQLLQSTGEARGNDFERLLKGYEGAAGDYLDRGLRKEGCKCLFELAGLYITAERFEEAKAVLDRADEVIFETEMSGCLGGEEVRMWSYGNMGQMNYEMVTLGSLRSEVTARYEAAVKSEETQRIDSWSLTIPS